MDEIKAEKEMAIRRFRHLRQIGRLLRCIEAAAFLLILSYSSSYIPSVAKRSGDFIRLAVAFLVSPRFVFLLGNAIVLVLLKSGHFSSESSATAAIVGGATGPGEFCNELSYPPPGPTLPAARYEEKTVLEIRACRRSRSEKFERRRGEGKLRRAETEICRKEGKICLPPAHDRKGVAAQNREEAGEVDDDVQFRRTIEEFIAKQQRFRREESLAVVTG